ncbi:hypothetical protein Pmar_PMAR017229 [Perkinsus marinus ATCC 50983]|uniref:EamA domain-containing protein n=1 Tax=Perkinsus marinus (strain ATCC 50983 / TXsc) TaxID=423536 RepID=C5KNB3_PERM5|nr:hypothetical protein Pmar_PMAR017229 [Perkinsus marinus ATCC 50983]EER14027.1 hypothetical protein Pmar_PMAR017229 [Perkinsus marinus ATCC 50983]|eukprot:XP_002782232.1 hypothetical protein Pmar_PMAR017229 [Perkinsus marinus ATCC 50983]
MSSNSSQSQLARRGFVPVLMLLVVVCGTFNAITGKIRAVALGEYSGMLSNLGFQVVYFLIYALVLAINAWSRRVPQEQWHWILIPRESAGFDGFIKGTCDFMKRLPGMKFAALAGILEATANYLIFSTQGYLSVSMYKLLQQFTVPSTLLWSVIFLRARYIFQELLAVVLVVLIAVVAIVVPNDEEKSTSSNGGVSASVLLGLAMIMLSCSFVIKELMFLEYKTYAKLKNYEVTDLNIFLMCTSTNFVGVIFVIPISFCLEIATGQDDVGGIFYSIRDRLYLLQYKPLLSHCLRVERAGISLRNHYPSCSSDSIPSRLAFNRFFVCTVDPVAGFALHVGGDHHFQAW